MKMTLMLFQVDFDRFSVLAFDQHKEGNIWKVTFESRQDLIGGLESADVVTADDVQEIEEGSCFANGAPIIYASVDQSDLERAGFRPTEPFRPN
jgi:hypothetical protein